MKRHYSSLIKILKIFKIIGTCLILFVTALVFTLVTKVFSNAFVLDNAFTIIVGILLCGGLLAVVFYTVVEWLIAVIDLLCQVENNTQRIAENSRQDTF